MARSPRWSALWRRLGAVDDGLAVLHQLERHYADPGRHYHDLRHLDQVLATFDELRDACERPDEAELALWLHDVVWQRRPDDEEQSADWAVARMAEAGIAPVCQERVAALIRATRHEGPARDADEAVVLDADLAVLGAEPAAFDAYEADIRQEYADVSDADFRRGRAAVLRRFLSRPAIYATAPMRSRREAQARANLERSLASLERGAVGGDAGTP